MTSASPGQRLAGRYTLVRELGRGGMGSVWEAQDESLGRRVAVKMMTRDLAGDDTAIARFEREARAVANLHSPHIVELHDYGFDEGHAFMVMELLRGEDLDESLRDSGPLPLDVVARIIAQTAKALTTAHQAGIVHRDLKPANLFLVRDDDDEFVKVFDFGIAKVFAGFRGTVPRKLTAQGDIIGTPRYMSPEQLASKDSDPRDDVWALSVIAYRALTGAHAFDAKGMMVVDQILKGTPPPPSAHVASVRPDVDAIFSKAFTKSRDGRFQSARELAQALLDAAEVSLNRGVARRRSNRPAGDPAAPEAVALTPRGASLATPVELPARDLVSESSIRGNPTHSDALSEATTRVLRRNVDDADAPSGTGPLGMALPEQKSAVPRALLAFLATGAVIAAGVVGWVALSPTASPAIEPPPGLAAEPSAPAPAQAAPVDVALDDPAPAMPPQANSGASASAGPPLEATASAAVASSARRAPPSRQPPPRDTKSTTPKIKSGDDLFNGVF